MAVATRFDRFSEDLATGVHNLNTHTLSCYLSNTTPDNAADAVKADLAEIATGNGYTGPVDTQNATSRTGAVTSVTGVDFVITATGAVGPFRYVVLCNTSVAGNPLIQRWDYGSSITLATGETFTTDFGTSMLQVG